MNDTIIVLGMPGVGKSTVLCRLKSINAHFKQFSVRLFTQQLMEGDTSLGKYLRESGMVKPKKLIPDEVVEQIFSVFMETVSPEDLLVIEGFPINEGQYRGMARQLSKVGRQLDKVFVLEDEEKNVLSRITNRLVCPACELKNGAGLPIPPGTENCPYCGGRLERRKDDDPEFWNVRCSMFRKELRFLSDLLPPECIAKIDVAHEDASQAINQWRLTHGQE